MDWITTKGFHHTCWLMAIALWLQCLQFAVLNVQTGFIRLDDSRTTPARRYVEKSNALGYSLQPKHSNHLTVIETVLTTLSGLLFSEAYAGSVTPNTEDLNETLDARFTQAVRDRAEALGNDPVKIYQWVRNNIEFKPGYGSILGSKLCLSRQVCNSFDIASLLIALFRVSGIPAHYARGQIQVPIDKAINWLNVHSADEVLFELESAQIPATLASDAQGAPTAVRFEHVWVSAFVDYVPSRAEVSHSGDQYISLDASFKRHDEEAVIIQDQRPILLGTLPYTVLSINEEVAGLADELRLGELPPNVKILEVAEVGTGQLEIRGSVFDDNLLNYQLEYGFDGSDVFIPLASGNMPVDGVLGTLDGTVLENGFYTIRLRATDGFGTSKSTTLVHEVTGQLKIGNFSLAFQDLVIPVVGLPISITRSYNSFDKAKGSFGIGWSLAIADIKLQEDLNRNVFITLPDSRRVRFGFTLGNWFGSLIFLQAQWVPEPGVYDRLEILGDDRVLFDGAIQQKPLFFMEDQTIPFECYEPPGYKLTLKSGVKLFIEKQVESFQVFLDPPCGKQYSGPVYGEAKLTKIEDRNGNTLTFIDDGIIHSSGKSVLFERDNENRITKITDPNGNSLNYAYDNKGDLISFTDQETHISQYIYDSKHNLVDIIDPRGIHVARTEYDDSGKITAAIDAQGNRVEFSHNLKEREELIRDVLGNITRFTYDAHGNVLSQEQAVTIEGEITLAKTTIEYDEQGNQIAITDPDGRRVEGVFDAKGNITQARIDPTGLHLVTKYNFNVNSQPTKLIDPLGNDALTLKYDNVGRMTRVTDSLGSARLYQYTSQGQVKRRDDPLGNFTLFEYDVSGNLTVEEIFNKEGQRLNRQEFAYDDNGNRISESTFQNIGGTQSRLTTEFTYDKLNRLIATKDPLGNTSRIEYNAIGMISARIDKFSQRISLDYDNFGNLIKKSYPDGTFETLTYDVAGNLIQTIDQSGHVTRYHYDELKRQIKTLFNDNTSIQKLFSPGGRLIAEIDSKGNRIDKEYDQAGRLVRIISPQIFDSVNNTTVRPTITYKYDASDNLVAIVDAEGNRTQFVYNNARLRTKTIFSDGNEKLTRYDESYRIIEEVNEEGLSTSYTYDNLGNLSSVTLPAALPDNVQPVTTYSYDQAGNKISQTDAIGNITTFEYDALNRLTKRIFPGGEFSTYQFDAANLISYTDFVGSTNNYTYDELGRLTKKSYPDGSTVEFTYTPTGHRKSVKDSLGITTYAYDDLDRLEIITNPDGDQVIYTYEDNGNLASISSPNNKVDYRYDSTNQLTSVIDSNGEYKYFYDPSGNRVKHILPNGVQTEYAYDTRNRLIQLTHRKNNAQILSSFNYKRSSSGKITQVKEASGATTDYFYDNQDRIAKEIRTGFRPYEISYEYDRVGNRVKMLRDGQETSFVYNAKNQLTSAAESSYEYDQNGNLILKENGTDSSRFSYDFEGRLINMEDSKGKIDFRYDADGNRIAKTSALGTIQYLVGTQNLTGFAQVLEEHDDTGKFLGSYTIGTELLNKHKSSSSHFYHQDGQRNIRLLSDTSGDVTDSFLYDSYGNLVHSTGETINNYLFAGEQKDSNLGLYYLRARYYDPAVGRFISHDPFGGFEHKPISLQPYLYANANPANVFDPSGQLSIPELEVVQLIRGILRVTRSRATAASASSFLNPNDFKSNLNNAYLMVCLINALTSNFGFGIEGTLFGGEGIGATKSILKLECESPLSQLEQLELRKKIVTKVGFEFFLKSGKENKYNPFVSINLDRFTAKSFAQFSVKNFDSFVKTRIFGGQLQLGEFDLIEPVLKINLGITGALGSSNSAALFLGFKILRFMELKGNIYKFSGGGNAIITDTGL